MPQQENDGTERISVDAEELEETLRILEQYSPQSPYLDNIHGHQELAELDKVRDWVREAEKCGLSISEIRPNLDENGKSDDPPDVLASMNGKLIGIEVTDLVEYPKEHALSVATADCKVTTMRWTQRQNGTFRFRWHGAELAPEETWRRRKCDVRRTSIASS